MNLLKIDVQGAETLVLRGAADMLRRRAIDLVYTELQIMHHYQGQSYYFDVCDYLHRSGYDLYGLHNFAVSSVGRFGWPTRSSCPGSKQSKGLFPSQLKQPACAASHACVALP